MASASCAAGAAVALGVESFDYNRENFQYDRDQRLEKEFTCMEMRIAQAGQWREDVSDLVSLTEKKMHIYLLSTILLVLVTIFLWTEVEDTLDETTPSWLIAGFALALTGAFLFLLLSIWLAIHAAVSAQGYSARLRTQMVRLPIPSWEEMEACRTYGSQFEKAEGRQMFRIPFALGKQENLVSTASEDATDEVTEGGSPRRTSPPSFNAEKTKPSFNDPWGLERATDDPQGLGTPLGADVASLRHIKITRQVAKLWQTYDAFARVALTIGVNQLILTLSYYYLAYLVIDVNCKGAGLVAVIMLTVMSDACFKIEISLQSWQLSIAQLLGILGPFCGLVAAYHTTTDLSNIAAHWWIPFAFFAHGLFLLFMVYLCKVKTLRSGLTVPQAFKQKLYLDVFGWIKVGSVRPSPVGIFKRKCMNSWTQGEEAEVVNQPAIQVMRYENGKSCPSLPQDFAVPYDMRFEQGACDPSAPVSVESKASIPFCQWDSTKDINSSSGDADADEIVTGHDAEPPGTWPWIVFSTALTFLGVVWIVAAAWRLEKAIVITKHAVSWTQMAQLTQSEHVSAMLDTGSPLHPLDVREVLSGNYTAYSSDPAMLSDVSLPDLFHLWSSGYLGSVFSKPWMELVPATWPYANIKPRTLSCDSSGQHFLVTDGFAAFQAMSTQKNRYDVLNFMETSSPILAGEHLQDAALACSQHGKECDVFMLHRHGKRIASCKLSSAGMLERCDSKTNLTDISETWLERDSPSNAEKVATIASRPFCKGGLAHCTMVHTSHGRTLLLRQRTRGYDLIPEEVLQDGLSDIAENARHQTVAGVMRTFNGRYAGVLHTQRQSVELLDVARGGLSVGKLLLPPQLHVTSWCAGGQHLFMLSEEKVWRVPLPEKLAAV